MGALNSEAAGAGGLGPQAGEPADVTRVVTEVADLAAIYDPAVAVCVLRRHPSPEAERFIREVLSPRPLQRTLEIPAEAPAKARELLPDLDGPGRDAFLADLAELSEIYAELLGPELLGLRLLSTGAAHCPRFHVDRVLLRMMCTYAGPGTEWLDGDGADRRYLGAGAAGAPDERSGLLRDAGRVRRLGCWDVGLLKGEVWPGRRGRGVVHRSPAVPAGGPNRVFFSVETLR